MLEEQNKIILGVDPGRSKTGLALTDDAGSILALKIAKTALLQEELKEFLGSWQPSAIVMGDGTYHKEIGAEIKQVLLGLELVLVDEAHSTEEARNIYWQENPPKGWRRLIPLGLLVPDEPLDAYAAVVQVRRWLQKM